MFVVWESFHWSLFKCCFSPDPAAITNTSPLLATESASSLDGGPSSSSSDSSSPHAIAYKPGMMSPAKLSKAAHTTRPAASVAINSPSSPINPLVVAMKIAEGMAYLHKHGILHGSLNPHCVKLVFHSSVYSNNSDNNNNSNNGGGEAEVGLEVKVCFYGMNGVFDGDDAEYNEYLTRFAAPELLVLDSSAKLTCACDVYSFGVLMSDLISLTTYFDGVDDDGDDDSSSSSDLPAKPKRESSLKISQHTVKTLKMLVRQCCEAQQEKRPSFAQLSRALAELVS